MEGNACYHYRTAARYLRALNKSPVKSILEIGVCLGSVTAELNAIFPTAKINGYEALKPRFDAAINKLKKQKNIRIINAAITGLHLYVDDLGNLRRKQPATIVCYEALPTAGDGWVGGSKVNIKGSIHSPNYVPTNTVITKTLKEALNETQEWTGEYAVDYLKTDCEGSEASFLGTATEEDLNRIRWIAGEYHNLDRFWPVVEKLKSVYRINLVGGKRLGSFFCERLDEEPGLLLKNTTRPCVYSNLSSYMLSWNIFDKDWVSRGDRRWHGINN